MAAVADTPGFVNPHFELGDHDRAQGLLDRGAGTVPSPELGQDIERGIEEGESRPRNKDGESLAGFEANHPHRVPKVWFTDFIGTP